MGVAYSALGEYKRSEENSDGAVRLDPRYAKAYYNRGLAHEFIGKT